MSKNKNINKFSSINKIFKIFFSKDKHSFKQLFDFLLINVFKYLKYFFLKWQISQILKILISVRDK